MYKILKRVTDILIAGLALVILSPILLLAIIILLLTGEHEVFYYQKRIGYKNKPFHILKFATMLMNSPNIGTGHITLRNDPRVTWFGKVLRITKINELPQIINVFKGDMSIVGPRPLMESGFKLYSEEIQNKIYNVKPGITGIGSLVFRDEEKLISAAEDPISMYGKISPFKGALEMWYQKNASFYVDFMIIFLTAWSILFPNNTLQNKVFKDLPAKEFVSSLHLT
jgi:lipopolysaccharide/colanic/teichoic acid biosynthesis glycosyltransferase